MTQKYCDLEAEQLSAHYIFNLRRKTTGT